MTLKDTIKGDRMQAMKNKNREAVTVLGTLLGELDRVSKEPTDVQVINVIKKMVESNKLTNCSHENQYLEIYLPKTMSENEIRDVIQPFIKENGLNSAKAMGLVMKFLKENHGGQYDGKTASDIVRQELNK